MVQNSNEINRLMHGYKILFVFCLKWTLINNNIRDTWNIIHKTKTIDQFAIKIVYIGNIIRKNGMLPIFNRLDQPLQKMYDFNDDSEITGTWCGIVN